MTTETVLLVILIPVAMKTVEFLWNTIFRKSDKTDDRICKVEEGFAIEIKAVEERFTKEHDKLEQKVDRMFTEINTKLEVIKSSLDRGSGLERPVTICRDYIDKKVDCIERKIDHLIDISRKEK